MTNDVPVTFSSLKGDFETLGIKEGSTILVHSSLSSLGWVCGGAVAVIQALEDVLGNSGTLVMPTQSADLSDPSIWQHPTVPESWWETIRKEMPAYDPDLTPTKHMGVIPETFRKQRGTIRSLHPQVSFAARGKNAEKIVSNHDMNFPLGEGSPLARIYDLDGYVLLLGVSHSNNTSIHLAEYRANFPWKKIVKNFAPILVDGVRRWAELEDINGSDFDFEVIGVNFERTGIHVQKAKVGSGCRVSLMRQRSLVDFAVEWMNKNRK